jgi:oligoendopeptidase F
MDAETLDALLGAIREALPDFRRYLKAKAKLLGHPNGLPFWDLFAPVGKSMGTFTPEEARAYLIDVLGAFTPEMADFVNEAFDHRWIDLFPKAGKTGGAFCSSTSGAPQSWILANFSGSFSDVSTLAHELGHAFHTRCLVDAPPLQSDYPMPLAETASIFNETLVTQYAIAHADPEAAFSLLEASLMESTQVIVDIYSRYLFESEVVETAKDRAMTAAELKDAMLRAQAESYGDGLDPDARHPYLWACKSHYSFAGLNFYNFPYAFGLLFGLGVYARYQAEGAAFVPAYKRLLAATAGAKVAEVAASVGIDVRDPAFWRSSLKVLRGQIDQFTAQAERL